MSCELLLRFELRREDDRTHRAGPHALQERDVGVGTPVNRRDGAREASGLGASLKCSDALRRSEPPVLLEKCEEGCLAPDCHGAVSHPLAGTAISSRCGEIVEAHGKAWRRYGIEKVRGHGGRAGQGSGCFREGHERMEFSPHGKRESLREPLSSSDESESALPKLIFLFYFFSVALYLFIYPR